MGDSLVSKVFLALLGAAVALFAKVAYEAWQRWRTWDLLSASVALRGGWWTVQIENRSEQQIASAIAYLSIDCSSDDFVRTQWIGLAAPGGGFDPVFSVWPKLRNPPLDELALSWKYRSNGEFQSIGSECGLRPGEVRMLSVAKLYRALCQSDPTKGLIHEEALQRLSENSVAAIVFASEDGEKAPVAILKGKRYRAILRIASESIPAKAFELEINPDVSELVRVLRVIPRPTALDRWESQVERG